MLTLDLGHTQTKHGPPILNRLNGVKSPRVVEVGVYRGKLSHYLLSNRSDLSLWMVDTWRELPDGSPGRDFSKWHGDPCCDIDQNKHDDNRATACAVADYHAGRAIVAATDSQQAAKIYQSAKFDMVFLDGGHWHDQVAADLKAWWPLVKPGGWIGGHDYGVMPMGVEVPGAVDPFFSDLGLPIELDAFYTWFVQKPLEVNHAA